LREPTRGTISEQSPGSEMKRDQVGRTRQRAGTARVARKRTGSAGPRARFPQDESLEADSAPRNVKKNELFFYFYYIPRIITICHYR